MGQTPLYEEGGGKLMVQFLGVLQTPCFISCLATIV